MRSGESFGIHAERQAGECVRICGGMCDGRYKTNADGDSGIDLSE